MPNLFFEKAFDTVIPRPALKLEGETLNPKAPNYPLICPKYPL